MIRNTGVEPGFAVKSIRAAWRLVARIAQTPAPVPQFRDASICGGFVYTPSPTEHTSPFAAMRATHWESVQGAAAEHVVPLPLGDA
ncbi:MAG TPA: hypothetical protein VF139_07520 [Candidatus Polarisedimenticolaceae bacterium]